MSAHGWMITATGRRFYPATPRPEDVCVEDVAHALSNICRFGGHVRSFYSVAQHSLLVSRLIRQDLALVGLMHDATEAYLGDMVRPLKEQIDQFQKFEDRVGEVVARALGFSWWLSPIDAAEVKRADNVALVTERRDLLPATNGNNWREDEQGYVPDCVSIVPMSPARARWLFTRRYCDLTGCGFFSLGEEPPA